MWKLTIEDDEGKQTALPLAHDEYGIGRAESNAIRLTDRNVSRNHAQLKRNGQGWVLRDQQSYNGVYVNGARVATEQFVKSGDVIQLGDYRIELIDESQVAAVTPSADAGAVLTPVIPVRQRPNRLVVVVGPSPGTEYPLDKEHFTIGRAEDATISINHSSVSRLHAELIALGNGRFEIVDKGSANGIRINGVELKRGILEAGDALELGDVRLRFVGAGKIFRAGFDQSQALHAVASFESGVPSGGKSGGLGKLIGIGAVVGVVIIGAVVFFARGGNSGTPGQDTHHVAGPMTDEAANILKEARGLVASKDFEGAHQKLLELPDSSPARDDDSFTEVEAAWADWMFRKVDETSDNGEKKKLLKTISTTPSVDAERRKKAADMVQEIEAKEPPPPPPVVYQPSNPSGGSGNSSGTSPSSTADAPKPDKVAPTSDVPIGLSEEEKMKKRLEPRVWSGKASIDEIRMLKAICGHLGDRACRDRAASMLKKKQQEMQGN